LHNTMKKCKEALFDMASKESKEKHVNNNEK
jgi:hypothetical protein